MLGGLASWPSITANPRAEIETATPIFPIAASPGVFRKLRLFDPSNTIRTKIARKIGTTDSRMRRRWRFIRKRKHAR
jgi:hypothetical protein